MMTLLLANPNQQATTHNTSVAILAQVLLSGVREFGSTPILLVSGVREFGSTPMAFAAGLIVIEKNTFLTVVPEAEEVSETKSAPDLTMYQDLSFMEDAQLHGYSIGDEMQWMEQDECYLMKGTVVGESKWQLTWDACIMVRFKNQKYKVRVTSIAPRAMNPHRSARLHETHGVLSAESDICVDDISRDYFEDGRVVF